MDAFMLEGWTPILLMGAVAAIIVFLIARKVSMKFLFTMATILTFICCGVLIYSIIGVGGWDGMGIGFVTITVFIGIWIGTLIGTISQRRREDKMSNAGVTKKTMTNRKATASLILGILSILLFIIPLASLILGIIGLILGITGVQEINNLKQEGKVVAISGIVCSSLGVLLPIALTIIGYLAFMNIESTIS